MLSLEIAAVGGSIAVDDDVMGTYEVMAGIEGLERGSTSLSDRPGTRQLGAAEPRRAIVGEHPKQVVPSLLVDSERVIHRQRNDVALVEKSLNGIKTGATRRTSG